MVVMTHPELLAITLVLLCSSASMLWGFPFGPVLELDVIPRTTVPFNGLLGCNLFRAQTVNYSTLLLEDGADILYVGAREALYALDTSNISAIRTNSSIDWAASVEQKKQCLSKGRDDQTECYNYVRFLDRYNETHLYTCGTHAFRPRCAYIDVERFIFVRFEEGKDKCPYDPVKGYTGFIVDSEMYSASQYEFLSSPDIRRNFPFPNLKTEDAPTRWLLEADFVGSALLRESINSSIGDDDKVYFFFTERNPEQKPYSSQTRVARVARVCKGDIGGQRTLQRKWTSFLKARLVCSFPEYELQFNILRGVYVLEGPNVHDSLVFAIFGLEWKNVKTSVICQYSIKDVQTAFNGPYMELQDSKWREYSGKVPDLRPGSCITDQHRAQLINSSRDLPDNVLMFARRHPLMAREIRPIGGRPLLFKKSTDYTRIAVLKVTALDGNTYNMIFTGTDDGWMHKAVQIGNQVHIIEELQLFKESQPINNMVISYKQKSVYVSAASGVVQVPLSSCMRYTSCYGCVFARDPLCGWDGRQCVEISTYPVRSNLTQDIHMGNRGCDNITEDGLVTHRTRSVMVGHDMLLLCELRSNLAVPHWTLNGEQLQSYAVDTGFRIGTDGLLIIEAQTQHSGHYCCYGVENAVWIPVRSYMVRVQPIPPPSPHLPTDPTALPERFFTTSTLSVSPSSESIEQPLHPLPSRPEFHTNRHMEAMYISLVAVLGGLCLVLTVVLLYVSFCAHSAPGHKKYSQHELSITPTIARKRSSHVELKTISSHCNGRTDGLYGAASTDGEFLQIISIDGQISPNKEPPPAPPLPMPPPLPATEYANGLSATIPSVLRKINGNSYVLLSQMDSDMTSPLYHSFTEELNRILEKRKHTQLDMEPDESSV
ncbi:semaphorin-4G [Tachysurus fulvidraco]|uniref:semaphorin-4G n=1 Tax=Tachysurus fulvidraco TaxID=1234273 RepID=UPI001FEE85FA|nr:semaphorin-4G [Tachysurus fulvidraco]XP_026996306.2 semaphorin-4G [Tachysurus fulvidraco]XP_026996307.2 semaphorin-4G [Tachysurus fulvidraco]